MDFDIDLSGFENPLSSYDDLPEPDEVLARYERERDADLLPDPVAEPNPPQRPVEDISSILINDSAPIDESNLDQDALASIMDSFSQYDTDEKVQLPLRQMPLRLPLRQMPLQLPLRPMPLQLPLRRETQVLGDHIPAADAALVNTIREQLSQHWQSQVTVSATATDDMDTKNVLEWCDQLVHGLILQDQQTSGQLIRRAVANGHSEQSFIEFVNQNYGRRRFDAMMSYAQSKAILASRPSKKIGFRKNYAPIVLYFMATMRNHCEFIPSQAYIDEEQKTTQYEIHVPQAHMLSFYNAFTGRLWTGVQAKYIRLRLSNYGIETVIHPRTGDLYLYHRDIQPQRLVYLMWQHESMTTYPDRRKAREERHKQTIDQLGTLRSSLPAHQREEVPMVRDVYRRMDVRRRTQARLPSRSYVKYLYQKYRAALHMGDRARAADILEGRDEPAVRSGSLARTRSLVRDQEI
jgi:hypothetical protein